MVNEIEKLFKQANTTPQKIMDEEYKYQPELTKKLDNLEIEDFNRELFYEIILWKLNRFPQIDDELLEELKSLSKLKPKDHRKSEKILKKLLLSKGIALPMAATILRFINPKVFQIIDDRTDRIIFGPNEKACYPKTITKANLDIAIGVYFDYLDSLHIVCTEDLPFEQSDRILYQLDIMLGNKLRS